MRTIDLATWPRRQHFELYHSMTYPHFSLCANVDIQIWYQAIKARQARLSTSLTFVFARAANEQVAFRWRIRGDSVVEHDRVDPSPTVLLDDDLFSFCVIPYRADYHEFSALAEAKVAEVKANPTISDEPGQDNLLYMTSIPWVSFTSMMHPVHLNPIDSVPRISWGKHTLEGQSRLMPVAVQVHHGLMDGLHVGRFYERVQAILDHPEQFLA